jgi:hypothetical protein
MLDEVSVDDADYITTSATGQTARLALTPLSDPGNDNNHVLRYRASSPEGDLGVTARVVQYVNQGIITSKQPWRNQPQVKVEINWDNPITQGLELVSTPTTATTVYKGSKFSTLSSVTSSVAQSVRLRKGTIAAGLFRKVGAATVDNVSYLRTGVLGEVWPSNMEPIFEASNGTSGNRKFYFIHNNSTLQSAGTIPSAGSYTHKAFLYDGSIVGAWANAYMSGVLDTVLTKNGTFPWDSAAMRYFMAGENSLGIYANYLYSWSRVLDTRELKEISKNPWQIFKPKKQIGYFGSLSTIIATRTPTLTTVPTNYVINMTNAEASLITDYTKLCVEFESL